MTSEMRILARRVVHCGSVADLSLVEIRRGADGLWRVSVAPFESETASTTYHGGTLLICDPDNSLRPYDTPGPRPPKLILL